MIELLETLAVTPLDICFLGWMKNEAYKRKVDTRYELLAHILHAAIRVKKCEDQLRRTTRGLYTRVAKCIEIDGGIFEHLLWTFKKFVISV